MAGAQEEDATDLQFPKGVALCGSCLECLQMPYIKCTQCKMGCLQAVYICLRCFANGAEFHNHKNSHTYDFIHNNFTASKDGSWTRSEELNLLEAVDSLGMSSWDKVSSKLDDAKTPSECNAHFNMIFNLKVPKKLLASEDAEMSWQENSLCGSDLKNVASSSLYGYNLNRSEFEFEYDNNAESLMSDLNYYPTGDQESDKLQESLLWAIGDSYMRRLGERQKRRKMIENHGLMMMDEAEKHAKYASSQLPPQIRKLLPKLHQFMSWEGISLFVTGFTVEKELRARIKQLRHHRSLGLTNHAAVEVHDEQSRICSHFQTTLNHAKVPVKQEFQSLNFLTDDEKALLSHIDVDPMDYLRFKKLLKTEFNKEYRLSLKTARSMLKIDVNVTKQIYEFLLPEFSG